MPDKGNQYAIAALRDRRATLAGEIVQFKDAIAYREEQLSHLDATLRILDPSYRADTIAPKRLRRVKLFGGGELNRLILDAMRRAGGTMGVVEIARSIAEAKGYGNDAALPALTRRVRANLTYLRNRSQVIKKGDRLSARWSLPQTQS